VRKEAYNLEKFRDRMEQKNILDLDPSQLTPEILDKLAEHLIRRRWVTCGRSDGEGEEAIPKE